ncbi:MAG: 16S rRNA (cytidine(1402)-2'-O)-methyltransferase [Steroidobacteraceae bacterium]
MIVTGRLEVIATPIGNLGDLTDRARESLARAHVIAAEDTRRTLVLLQAIGIARPLVALHAHNERERVPELIERMVRGETVALVSDAGTPLLSDPGFELVRQAIAARIDVRSIPGPSAITAALSIAGLPVDRFCFEGFLPANASERRAHLHDLAHEMRTLVFFEAPHRIADCLDDLAAVFGAGREAALARELTKTFETVYRGTLAELAAVAHTDANVARGEITIVVRGAATPAEEGIDMALLRRTVAALAPELPPSRAAALAAQITGAKRSTAYELVRELSVKPDPQIRR